MTTAAPAMPSAENPPPEQQNSCPGTFAREESLPGERRE